MPRKQEEKEEEIKKVSNTETKKSSRKQTTQSKAKIAVKENINPKEATNIVKTRATKKKTTSNSKSKNLTDKKETVKTNSTSKTTKKSATSKSSNSSKKISTKSAKKVSTSRSSKSAKVLRKIEVLEYYDLPYRYNQTVVKLLAQTPTTLFVYWDISDLDRENLVKTYGEKFFEETKPVLIIHNETNNYSFEVDINDFANSWYLHISDSKCVYNIELGRRPIYKSTTFTNISKDYIYITSSNKLEAPNDHILFDKLGDTVYFRNVKINIIEEKKITSLSFIQNMGKIYNIYDIYKKIYPAEDIKDFDLNNPSSGNPSSFF